MRPRLQSELSKHELFRERLLKEFPDEDEETLADTLEGMTDLTDMIAVTLRSELEDRALAKGLKGRIDEMHERLERFVVRADKKREMCLDTMEQANLSKITAPDFTASLRSNPVPLIISEQDKIPTMFFEPQPDRLDKRKLRDALDKGEQIPGAVLGNAACTLSIRTK